MQTKAKKEIYSEEAEKSLLACLLNTDSGDTEMLETIFTKVKAEDFADIRHQHIFTAMQMLFAKGKSIDLVTVMELLERMLPNADEKAQLALLVDIGSTIASNVNYMDYVNIVNEHAKLRILNFVFSKGEEQTRCKQSSAKIISDMQERLCEYEASESGNNVEHISSSFGKELERITNVINGNYDDFGLSTGFPILDKTLWGMQKSDLIIVGARAGVGKTAFALNILNHAANKKKSKCLFFSLEMPSSQISQRLVSMMTEIPNSEVKRAKGLQGSSQKIQSAEREIQEGHLYIDDTTNNTVAEMMLKAKRMQRQTGLDLVVVDYLQFVKPSQKSGNRFQDVGEIARDLKVMARQLNVPLIALCQLNRGLDTADRQPTLADLRESGEIENNADIIMFLNPTEKGYDKPTRSMELIIGKFRNGAQKAIKMEYEGSIFKFRERDKLQKEQQTQMSMIELPSINDGDLPF